MDYSHYTLIADIFRYPDEHYKENVARCEELMINSYPEIYKTAAPFFDFVRKTNPQEIEYVFGKTFHIQAICYLDLGYVLFAEDYKRGDFLVKVKNEQEKVNNDCGIELADNLPNVLTLMTLFEDHDFREEFAERILYVALQKMLEEFEASRSILKDKVRMKKQRVIIMQDLENVNSYSFIIDALCKIVKSDFNIIEKPQVFDPTIYSTRDVLSHTKRNLPFN